MSNNDSLVFSWSGLRNPDAFDQIYDINRMIGTKVKETKENFHENMKPITKPEIKELIYSNFVPIYSEETPFIN